MKISAILLITISITTLWSCSKDDIDYNQTLQYGTLTDTRDDEIYKTIDIGNQVWMAENLRHRFYDYEEHSYCNYGKMYGVSSDLQYCPDGWKVPDSADFKQLIDYLGGMEVAGSKMKELGNNHWKNPNKGASNSSGFTALPAGYVNGTYGLKDREKFAHFWTSSPCKDIGYSSSYSYYYISLNYQSTKAYFLTSAENYEDLERKSIRCIKK